MQAIAHGVVQLPAMRSLRFLPLAFLAGAHGFALFAPYLALVAAALQLVRMRRSARLVAIPIVPPAPSRI